MKISEHIKNFKSDKSTVLTIGVFDGFHIGHQKIISRIVEVSEQKKLESVVLTFFPHPRMVLQKNEDIKLVHTITERTQILKKTKINHLIIHPFTKDFSQLSAINFVKETLVKQLKIKHIIIGYDHRFGKNRSATIIDLKKYGKEYGFTVEEISSQDINEVAVSSTKIRNAILRGNIKIANTYLGTPFQLSGTVVSGKRIGRTIDFPTANINIAESYKIIPKKGVYITQAEILGKTVFGMMNIGVNPTVKGLQQTIELHLLNFKANIYDEHINITLLKRIRDEQKFSSVIELKRQLQKDKKTVIKYFKKDVE